MSVKYPTNRVQQRAQHREHHLLVRVGADVSERLGPLRWQDTGRHVHAVARQSQEQAQNLAAVALMFPRGGNRRIAAYATLPDGMGDLGLALRSLGDCEVRKEKEVEERVYELFGERLRILKFLHGRLRLHILDAIKEHLVGNRRVPCRLATRGPEQLLFPVLQCLLFVDKRQDACENADAVQCFAVGREFGVGEGWVVAEHEQAVRHRTDQVLEVLERIVAGAAYVGGSEEAEYVFGRLGQLPELWSLD